MPTSEAADAGVHSHGVYSFGTTGGAGSCRRRRRPMLAGSSEYKRPCTRLHLDAHVCAHVWTHACAHACARVGTHACTRVDAHVYAHGAAVCYLAMPVIVVWAACNSGVGCRMLSSDGDTDGKYSMVNGRCCDRGVPAGADESTQLYIGHNYT